ncbi:FUSC family protein [Pararobbsia alpina]
MFRLPRALQDLLSSFRSRRRLQRAALHAGDAMTRHRPVWMTTFALADTSLSEGLRAACAATSMLVIGDVLHRPDFAWAAIGAFWTCLADAAGSNRMRFASMAGFAVLSTIWGALAALSSGLGVATAALAVFVFAAGGAIGRVWGPAVAQVTILSATACVVMVDKPAHHFEDAARLGAIYLLGCVCATALSLLFWRIHPFEPSRKAIERAFQRLADMCRDCARLLEREHADFGDWTHHLAHYRSEVRAALEEARAAIERVGPTRSDLRDIHANLLIALADAEHVFAFLIGVSDACERQHATLRARARVVRTLISLEAVLLASGKEAASASQMRPASQHDRFVRLAVLLERELGEPFGAVGALPPVELESAITERKPFVEAIKESLARAHTAWRANLTWNSMSLRHAARVGVATTLGFLVVRALHLSSGYWATMAILLILQPSIATTWPRSLERAAGSVIGGLIAAVIGLLIHSPVVVSIAVFPLVVATMALRPVSYSLFVMFLTPAFVLVAGFATPGSHELVYAVERLTNNVLGCVIAFAATFLLWPTREPDDFRERFASALGANLEYLAQALSEGARDAAEMEPLRRAAGLASNQAEASLQRARLETLNHSGAHWIALTALALCRRAAGTAARARLRAAQGQTESDVSAWIAASREVLVDAIEGGRRPQALPVLTASSPSSVASDAVHQVELLAAVVEQYASGARDERDSLAVN